MLEKKRIVLASYEDPSHLRCIDLFEDPSGSFQYELFRRDPEDPRGWQSLALPCKQSFETVDLLKSHITQEYGQLFELD
mgnify:CR=1 FL=1